MNGVVTKVKHRQVEQACMEKTPGCMIGEDKKEETVTPHGGSLNYYEDAQTKVQQNLADAELFGIDGHMATIQVHLLRSLLRSRSPLVVIGQPGTGKTTALKMAVKKAREVAPFDSLYINMRNLTYPM